MSTPSFGQPSPFGASVPPPPIPADETSEAKGHKTVVIAVAAGIAALGVLGGAAALVLGVDSSGAVDTALPPSAVSTVEPSAAPSTPPAPLPTSAVQGRNVFVPLVDADTAASGETVVDPVAATATPPAGVPTAAPTAAPVPVAAPAPLPPVTRTITVPGPTVTTPGPTVTTPGPTVTTPGPTETLDPFAYYVSAVQVTDPAGPGSSAEFMVNGQTVTVQEGEVFLEFFQYVGYSDAPPPETGATVRFVYGSAMWSVPTGRVIGLSPR